jgi:hypothetical protein
MSLKKLFGSAKGPPNGISHPCLGSVRFDEGEDSWVAQLAVEGHSVRFVIGGDREPDTQLLAKAESIVGSLDRFLADVGHFLEREAASRPRDSREIAQLRVADICLFWPDRPNDGMIFFSGPDAARVWRCDYLDGTLSSLGFDS